MGLYIPHQQILGPFGGRLSDLSTRRCQAACDGGYYIFQVAESSTVFELRIWAWKVEDGEAVHVQVQILGEHGAWFWEGEAHIHNDLFCPGPIKMALPNEEAAYFIFLAGVVTGMRPDEWRIDRRISRAANAK